MRRNCSAYQWTDRDKRTYLLALAPFLVAFLGAAVLIATVSITWTVVLLALYLLGCLFQAGCCVSCPYRGRYCPAIFGIYPANFLSVRIYGDRPHDQKFFNVHATLAASVVAVIAIYCLSFLFAIHWAFAVTFAVLGLVHIALFLRRICPKCGFNETCPVGRSAFKPEQAS